LRISYPYGGEVSILHFATVNFEVSIVKNDT
jgi:hypothetical protein